MKRFSPYALPWSTAPLWKAANQTIHDTIRYYQKDLAPLFDLANAIGLRLEAVGDYMSGLCSQTCPTCQEICCRHAYAYFDFKDLLCLHLGPGEWPPAQTLGSSQPVCRYLSDAGCALPRAMRPFICTWYLCPAQSAALEQMAPSVKVFLNNSFKAIKSGRQRLQHGYVQITAALPPGE